MVPHSTVYGDRLKFPAHGFDVESYLAIAHSTGADSEMAAFTQSIPCDPAPQHSVNGVRHSAP